MQKNSLLLTTLLLTGSSLTASAAPATTDLLSPFNRTAQASGAPDASDRSTTGSDRAATMSPGFTTLTSTVFRHEQDAEKASFSFVEGNFQVLGNSEAGGTSTGLQLATTATPADVRTDSIAEPAAGVVRSETGAASFESDRYAAPATAPSVPSGVGFQPPAPEPSTWACFAAAAAALAVTVFRRRRAR